MVARDSCCILGVSQATFEGSLLTLTDATLVYCSNLLIVSTMAALLLQDSLNGVSPVGSSLLESLRNPMLESSSTMVLAINEMHSLFNKIEQFSCWILESCLFRASVRTRAENKMAVSVHRSSRRAQDNNHQSIK